MTTQHIYKINDTNTLFWSDGKERRGPYYGMRSTLIKELRLSTRNYGYFSDFKASCTLLIPKEFC